MRIRFPMKARTCSKHMSSNVNKCYMHSSVMQSLYLQFMMNKCIVRESRKINVTNKKNVHFAGRILQELLATYKKIYIFSNYVSQAVDPSIL